MANVFDHDLNSRFSDDAERRASFEHQVSKIKSLGELLRSMEEARESQDLPKVEVARRLNKKPSAVSRALSGKQRNLTFSTIADLAYALNLELDIRIKRRPTRSRKAHEHIHVSGA